MTTNNQIVVVRVFMSRIEADLARSALEAAGIEADIVADDAGGMRPQLAGIALKVRADQARAAAEILDTDVRHPG